MFLLAMSQLVEGHLTNVSHIRCTGQCQPQDFLVIERIADSLTWAFDVEVVKGKVTTISLRACISFSLL